MYTSITFRAAGSAVMCWLKIAFLSLLMFFCAFAAQAQDRKGPRMTYVYDGPKVSFEQLYANPDDKQLNLNYARQQSARGDLLGASASLERLLFAEPNWHSARLFYAAVLYRLDDKKAAFRELELLSGSNMTERQRAIYEDYGFSFQYTPAETASADLTPEQIARSRTQALAVEEKAASLPKAVKPNSDVLFNGRLAIGARNDSNAGNALTDVAVGLTDQSDGSAFLIAGAQGQMPLGVTGLQLFGGLNGQTRRHQEFSRADFDTVGGHAGVFKDVGRLRLSAQYDADKVSVSGNDYLMQTGPRLTVSTHSNPDLRASLSVGHYDQDYSNLSNTSNDAAASGDKTVILARLTKKLNSKLAIGGSFGVEKKDARAEVLSYDAVRIGAHFRAGEEAGWQVRGLITRRDLSFKGAGSADLERINARIGVSAPISLITKSESLTNVRVEAAINYNQRRNDTSAPDFDNSGAELRLIWDF